MYHHHHQLNNNNLKQTLTKHTFAPGRKRASFRLGIVFVRYT